MKTWRQPITLLCSDEQKVVANGYPDLRVYCVLGGSVDSLNVNVLLYLLEELLNLPPFSVQFCDGERVFDGRVVGQEAIKLSGLEVLIHNKSQHVVVLPGEAIAGKPDHLIGKDTGS